MPARSSPPRALTLLAAALALGVVGVQQWRIHDLQARLSASALRDPADPAEVAEITRLRARVDRLEHPPRAAEVAPTAPVAAGSAAIGTTAPAVDAVRRDPDALLLGEAPRTPEGKARLRALVDEAQREQLREREQQRDERVLGRIAEEGRLTSRQRDDLSQALSIERTQRRALIDSARASLTGFDHLRPLLEALRAETDRKAKELLDADQYAAYAQGRGGTGSSRGPGGGARGGRALGPAAAGP